MRRPITTLLLAWFLALAGCGDDEPEQASLPQPTTVRPAPAAPAAETMAPAESAGSDTVTGEPEAAAAREGPRLYTVQLAAFTSADSAQKWTGRLRLMDLPVWMSMAERGGMTFYRVRVGAVRSFSEARRLGALMSDRLDWPVWVAAITPQDRPPEDALPATQHLLGD